MFRAIIRLCVAALICIQYTHAADRAQLGSVDISSLQGRQDLKYQQTLQRGAAFFRNYCAGCHALRYMRPDQMTGYQSLMKISMPEVDARQWFGRMPPDLSLTARERGPAWLHSYLTSFYADKNRPFGANNTLVPDVAMPNVLAPLKNQIKLERDLQDVVSFLVYVAEPVRLIRYRIGFAVIAFLAVLGGLIYRLKLLYWRNIC